MCSANRDYGYPILLLPPPGSKRNKKAATSVLADVAAQLDQSKVTSILREPVGHRMNPLHEEELQWMHLKMKLSCTSRQHYSHTGNLYKRCKKLLISKQGEQQKECKIFFFENVSLIGMISLFITEKEEGFSSICNSFSDTQNEAFKRTQIFRLESLTHGLQCPFVPVGPPCQTIAPATL